MPVPVMIQTVMCKWNRLVNTAKSNACAYYDSETALKQLLWHCTSLHPISVCGAGFAEGHSAFLLVFYEKACGTQVTQKLAL